MPHYLPILLALGITQLNISINYLFLNLSEESRYFSTGLRSALSAQVSPTKNSPEQLDYNALMAAGSQAQSDREYLKALNYFRRALSLRPEDGVAKDAVNQAISYSFDFYMQAGYQADRDREYETALEHFQTALAIKPDSFSAQQAINNTRRYLNLNENSEVAIKNDQSEWNKTLGITAIALISLFSLWLLIILFKKVDIDINQEQPTHQKPKIPQTPKTTNSAQNTQIINSHTTSFSKPLVPPSTSLSKIDIVPELIHDLQVSDRIMRQKTIWELAQRGDSRAMKPLVELMIEVDSQERSLILEAMTQITTRTLKPMNQAFMLSLQDENPQVKQNAIRDLTRVHELMYQVTKRLAQTAENSEEEVKETAQWALQQLSQMPVSPPWYFDNPTNNPKNSTN